VPGVVCILRDQLCDILEFGFDLKSEDGLWRKGGGKV